MPDKKIDILGVDTNNKLILSDGGNTIVDSNGPDRKIVWSIVSKDVKVFQIKGLKSSVPFDTTPPKVRKKRWS